MSRPIPITILITIAISIPISIAGTVAAANAGLLDSVINLSKDNEPLINGTIINKDNGTFHIIITPTDANVSLPTVPDEPPTPPVTNQTPPTPIPQPPPVTNQTPPVVNDTEPAPQPIPTPQPTPTPTPQPTPEPTTTDKKIIITGDVDNTNSGNAVLAQIKTQNPDNVIVLGDLGYDSDLKWFKSSYGQFGNKLLCVIGNHDAPEDGSSSIYAEAKEFCSTSFYSVKVNTAMFVGFDTSGDLVTQLSQAKKIFADPKIIEGVKNVHILTHKPCAVPDGSQHNVESKVKTFCDGINAAVPNTIKVYYDSAHNHNLAQSADKQYTTSGAGGRSHYGCIESTAWPFCNDSSYGFLIYTIKPDGTTLSQFVDYNGRVLE